MGQIKPEKSQPCTRLRHSAILCRQTQKDRRSEKMYIIRDILPFSTERPTLYKNTHTHTHTHTHTRHLRHSVINHRKTEALIVFILFDDDDDDDEHL